MLVLRWRLARIVTASFGCLKYTCERIGATTSISFSGIGVPEGARLGKLVIFRSSKAAFYLRPLSAEKRAFCNDVRPASDLCDLPKMRLCRRYATGPIDSQTYPRGSFGIILRRRTGPAWAWVTETLIPDQAWQSGCAVHQRSTPRRHRQSSPGCRSKPFAEQAMIP
jgi:hypothetical protein